MVERHDIIDALRRAMEACPDALAAYLGGSDATGRTDELSDVDLGVICEDGAKERTFVVIRDALAGLSELSYEYRMPEPAWHGMSQVFYALKNTADWMRVDVCVMERSNPTTFTERERHGEPMVWFDPEGLIVVDDLDMGAHREKVRAAVENARGMLGLGGPLVRKAVRRGFPAEAASFYHRLVLGQAVVLVRAQHCPERHDFGARYLDRDVPDSVQARLDRLSVPADLDAVLACTAECEAWARELLEELAPAFEKEPRP